MTLFNIGTLLRAFNRPEKKSPERIEIGDVVIFHDGRLHDPYARVTSYEEYVISAKIPRNRLPNKSVIDGIKTGDWLCLATERGAYFLLPLSAVIKAKHYVQPEKEIKL